MNPNCASHPASGRRVGNYGWCRMEAIHCFDYTKPDDHPASCDQSGLTLPILEHQNCTAKPNGCKGISVTGGYVYRGSHSARVTNGFRKMPSWREVYSREERMAVVTYVLKPRSSRPKAWVHAPRGGDRDRERRSLTAPPVSR